MVSNRKGNTRRDYERAAGMGMTPTEAAVFLGVSSQVVRRMANTHGIEFKKGIPGRKPKQKEVEESDARGA